MKSFQHVANLYINADNFLDGFLGLRCLPSNQAKTQVTQYELRLTPLLYQLWGKFSSAWPMYEIACAAKKRVDIVPPQFAPDYFPKNEINAYAGPKSQDSYKDVETKGTPGKSCMPERKQDDVVATGQGADIIISYDSLLAFEKGPGAAPDELLLHELVHAMRGVSGKGLRCFGAPRGYSDYEEFVAILITNVYSSEMGRSLRKDVEGFKPLPTQLCSSQAFFNQYKDYLLPLRDAHPHLCGAFQKAAGIPFNPFTLM